VALPAATAVTSPDDETVAIDAEDVDHVTLASLIVEPSWSVTVAVICSVAPMVEKFKVVGESVTEVATDVVVGDVVVVVGVVPLSPLSPHAANSSTATRRIHCVLTVWTLLLRTDGLRA